MLKMSKVYDENILFVVRMHKFGYDRLLLSWIVPEYDNMCAASSNYDWVHWFFFNFIYLTACPITQ